MNQNYIYVSNCPLCGADKNIALWMKGNINLNTLDEMHYEDYCCTSKLWQKYFDVLRCQNCGLAYSAYHLKKQLLTKFYGDVIDKQYVLETKAREKTFLNSLKMINGYCQAGKTLFEIGAYIGTFLNLARDNSWDVSGCEYSNWARNIAQKKYGLSLASTLKLKHIKNDSFDCIVMLDVLEHLFDLHDILSFIARTLKTNGILFLSTMDIDSLSAKLMGSNYPFLMKMHLLYFNHKSLNALFNLYGLKIIKYARHKRYISVNYFFKQLLGVQLPLPRKKYFSFSLGLRDIVVMKQH